MKVAVPNSNFLYSSRNYRSASCPVREIPSVISLQQQQQLTTQQQPQLKKTKTVDGLKDAEVVEGPPASSIHLLNAGVPGRMERSLTQRFKDKIKRGVHRVSLKRRKKDKKRGKEHGSPLQSGDEDSPDVLSHNDLSEPQQLGGAAGGI